MTEFCAIPCICCKKLLESVLQPATSLPHNGTLFYSSGNYGSTVFDPMNEFRLEIIICDDCLEGNAQYNVNLVNGTGKRELWKMRDTFEEEGS